MNRLSDDDPDAQLDLILEQLSAGSPIGIIRNRHIVKSLILGSLNFHDFHICLGITIDVKNKK